MLLLHNKTRTYQVKFWQHALSTTNCCQSMAWLSVAFTPIVPNLYSALQQRM
jgi:hypothetical protein